MWPRGNLSIFVLIKLKEYFLKIAGQAFSYLASGFGHLIQGHFKVPDFQNELSTNYPLKTLL